MTTGSADAVEAAADSVAKIKRDMEAISKEAAEFAKSMKSVTDMVSTAMPTIPAQGAAATGSTSFSASQVTSTGYSTGQGMRLGPISAMGGIAASTLVKIPFAGYNDLRIGANPALAYEQARRYARAGTGDYEQFAANLSTATNQYNVQSGSQLISDVATALNTGWSSAMGGGGTVGQRMVAENVGYMHTAAAYGGMNPAAVKPAAQSIYSTSAYYNAMAMGVYTRNPITGDPLSIWEITNQVFQRLGLQNYSMEEINRALIPGGTLNTMLNKTFGPAGAQLMTNMIRMQAETGGEMLTPETVIAELEASGAFGTEYTEGMDTSSMTQEEQIEALNQHVDNVTGGVATSNEWLQKIYEWLAQTDTIVGAAMSVGGFMDTLTSALPGLTKAISDGISGMSSILFGIMLMRGLDKRDRKKGVGGSGRGCCCGTHIGDDLSGKPGKKTPKTPGSGTKWKWGAMGLRGAGLVWGATSLVDWWNETQGAASEGSVQGEDIVFKEHVGTVLSRAAAGAAAGTAIMPGMGSLVGGLIGAGLGIVEAITQERNDMNPEEVYTGSELNAYAEGSWQIPRDQIASLHAGEMVLPNKIAEAVREELKAGTVPATSSRRKKGGGPNVTINVTIQRGTDTEAMLFARKMKQYLEQDDELLTIGQGSLR